VNREEAQALVHHIQEIWDKAKVGIKHAQQLQKRQADKHQREVNFGVGDKVMITTKDWNMGYPNRKLAEQSVGPYIIIEKVGNAYWIDLPESIKVHPIFHPEKLCKASSSEPLEGQILIPQLPVQVNGQDKWDVEQIIAVRLQWQKLSYHAK
jgi:hypothetical protein